MTSARVMPSTTLRARRSGVFAALLPLAAVAALALAACDAARPSQGSGPAVTGDEISAAEAAGRAPDFPTLELGSRGHHAEVVGASGLDGPQAAIRARHTLNTALDYCEFLARYEGAENELSGAALRACARKQLEGDDEIFTARADCDARTLTVGWGRSFRHAGRSTWGSSVFDRWVDLETQKELGSGSASNYDSVNQNFRALCPNKSAFLTVN